MMVCITPASLRKPLVIAGLAPWENASVDFSQRVPAGVAWTFDRHQEMSQ